MQTSDSILNKPTLMHKKGGKIGRRSMIGSCYTADQIVVFSATGCLWATYPSSLARRRSRQFLFLEP